MTIDNLKTCCRNALKHGDMTCPNCGEYLSRFYIEIQQQKIKEKDVA